MLPQRLSSKILSHLWDKKSVIDTAVVQCLHIEEIFMQLFQRGNVVCGQQGSLHVIDTVLAVTPFARLLTRGGPMLLGMVQWET